jgi:hypothetical protein
MQAAALQQAPHPQHRTPPMGIVVPASSPVLPRKDSVELLLDGMQGPQPERPKSMPQTDGQASAAYHAEHMVRPARTSPDEVPKVVVERPLQAATTRIDRAKVQHVIEQAEARRQAMEAPAEVPQQIGPRVIVAIVAGLVVVAGLFLVLRLTQKQPVPPAPPVKLAVPATATPTPTATAASTPTSTPIPATATATAADTAPPADTATAAPAAPPATTAPSASAKPKTPRPAAAGTGDIGEFKTTFH